MIIRSIAFAGANFGHGRALICSLALPQEEMLYYEANAHKTKSMLTKPVLHEVNQ